MKPICSVAVIDYGVGNSWSVLSAFRRIGVAPELVDDPESLSSFSHIVLPGVGSFRAAMSRLSASGMDDAIVEAVAERGRSLLGICLGMQLLGSSSTEDGLTSGLDLIEMTTERFSPSELNGLTLPNMGYSPVWASPEGLFAEIPSPSDFYFAHSFRVLPTGGAAEVAYSEHGSKFVAAVMHECISGTQFHPEKSQGQGLRLIANFVGMR